MAPQDISDSIMKEIQESDRRSLTSAVKVLQGKRQSVSKLAVGHVGGDL